MPCFAGLDLAWTAQRESGVCLLEGEGPDLRVLRLDCAVATPAAFADLLDGLGPDVVAAIDAPLVVHEARHAEADLGRVYGRYGAAAYAARPAFLAKMAGMAGPHLGAELRLRGWQLDPARLAPGARGRFAFESYPHAAHVAHFVLARILAYKKGPVAGRRAALLDYQGRLAALIGTIAPALCADPAVAGLLGTDPAALRGRALKQLEDRLDGLTCALTAVLAWRDGLAPCDIFGNAEHGAIAVPGTARVTARTRETRGRPPASPA